MSYETNPYYNPEKLGLTQVAEVEYSSGSYEFDTRVVWRTEGGALVTARDGGCSCPTPFESYNSVPDLEAFDASAIIAEIDDEAKNGYSFGPEDASAARRSIRGLT
jgi:hypothetical protein